MKEINKPVNNKIKESMDLSKIFNKLINKLNVNSVVEFWISDGSTSPMYRDSYKSFKLKNGQIKVDWLGKKITIKDKETINQIKDLIIKNKKELYSFYKRQTNKNGEFPVEKLHIGTYDDDCYGRIGLLPFRICNRFHHKELNDFYEKFKHNLFELIEKNISK